jgi:hypothetical protein
VVGGGGGGLYSVVHSSSLLRIDSTTTSGVLYNVYMRGRWTVNCIDVRVRHGSQPRHKHPAK